LLFLYIVSILLLLLLMFMFSNASSALTTANCSAWLLEQLMYSLYFSFFSIFLLSKTAIPAPTQSSLNIQGYSKWLSGF
jgi:hypothetical protein